MRSFDSWNFYVPSLLAVGLLMLTGCGGAATGSVSGTVKVNGAPVNGLELEFVPIGGGGPAMAYTKDGGKYTLVIGRGNEQIPVGEYKVAVRVFTEDPNMEIPKFKLGANYTSTEETELRRKVEGGANTIDFELEAKK